MPEAVNHPPHYGGGDNPYEAVKVIRAWTTLEQFLGGLRFNSLKYLSRAGKKTLTQPMLPFSPEEEKEALRVAAIQDLKKAVWYINREIEELEAAAPQTETAVIDTSSPNFGRHGASNDRQA